VAPLKLAPEALRILARAPWPGNVRELEGVLLRALIQTQGSGRRRLEADDLAGLLAAEAPTPPAPLRLLDRGLDELRSELEREYLRQLFVEVGGKTAEMVRRLGLRRSRFYAWLRELGIDTRALRRQL
jgi:DNA-binding NtrC family response regulator